MIHYLDTSLLVAIYAAERDHERLAQWLFAHAANDLAVSLWTRTEFSSALSIKIRTGQIYFNTFQKAQSQFEKAIRESFKVISFENEDFLTAARWCENHQTGIRSGDALHLAIAGRNLATLCTMDQKLAVAGRQLAVDTLLV